MHLLTFKVIVENRTNPKCEHFQLKFFEILSRHRSTAAAVESNTNFSFYTENPKQPTKTPTTTPTTIGEWGHIVPTEKKNLKRKTVQRRK